MGNFMQLANIQCALLLNHKQQNLFEFGNADLNASMFQNLCAISHDSKWWNSKTDSTQSVTTADNNVSIMLQIKDIRLFRYKGKKKNPQYSSRMCDDGVGRTGQDWCTSSIQLQFKLHLK